MKREGRQHGMVRTYMTLPSPWNPRPKSKIVNKLDCPPTAGFFTKVSSKPTNHSKFTGKCGQPRCAGCHIHPACKSKNKAKGAHKIRSRDMEIKGKVEDEGHGLNYARISTTGIMGHLSSDHWDDEEEDDDGNYDEEGEVGSRGIESEDNIDDGSGIRFGFVLDQEDGDGWFVVEEM